MLTQFVNLLHRLTGEENSIWRCKYDRATFFARLSEKTMSRQWNGAISRQLIVKIKGEELRLASDGHVLGLFPLPNHYVLEGTVGEHNGFAEINARLRFKPFLRIGVATWFVVVSIWIAVMIGVFLLSQVRLVDVESPPGGFLGLVGFGFALLGFGALIVALLQFFGRSSKQGVISVLSQLGCTRDFGRESTKP